MHILLYLRKIARNARSSLCLIYLPVDIASLAKSFPLVRIVFLDKIANEELSIHAHNVGHAGYHFDVETCTWECFSI